MGVGDAGGYEDGDVIILEDAEVFHRHCGQEAECVGLASFFCENAMYVGQEVGVAEVGCNRAVEDGGDIGDSAVNAGACGPPVSQNVYGVLVVVIAYVSRLGIVMSAAEFFTVCVSAAGNSPVFWYYVSVYQRFVGIYVIMTTIPASELYLPLLSALSDGKPKSIAALPDKTGQIYCVLPNDLGIQEPRDGSCEYLEPLLAASAELERACLITKSQSNVCQITDRGRELLKQGITRIDSSVLMRYPEYQKRAGK